MDHFIGKNVKIVYEDGGNTFCVRGIFNSHDEFFVYYTDRVRGETSIGKKSITKIEVDD